MKLFHLDLNDAQRAAMPPCVATIGFFDGVHRGHRYLIDGLKARAASVEGMQSTVITFDSHPRLVLHQDYRPRLLNTAAEKVERLSLTGVDNCVVLHFDEKMASLSAREFIQTVLHGRLNVRTLVIGYDNRFGRNRSEGFEDYVRYGRETGIDVVHADAFTLNGVQVSSSVVRSFLSEGEVRMAAMCLGYDYRLTGRVVGGYHEGRRMGFPTANIEPADSLKLVPRAGVYAVRVALEGGSRLMDGMMNIGTRPTFDGTGTTLEVNIFGFNGDLYGQTLTVMFVDKLRDERKFPSVKRLMEQLEEDRREAEKRLNPPLPFQME